jgi:hypothetical protein
MPALKVDDTSHGKVNQGLVLKKAAKNAATLEESAFLNVNAMIARRTNSLASIRSAL